MSYSYHARRLAKKHTQARWYQRDSYPFCWNVKMYGGPTFEQVFARMAKEHYHGLADALVCIKDTTILKNRWEDQDGIISEFILEDMRRTFTEDDTMRCCSPRDYQRFSYKPKTNELWEVKYEFVGRSGGWLALTEFEGVQTEHIDAEMWGGHVEDWYQKLCCQIVSTTWTVDHRDDEYLYQAAFQMQQLIERMEDE